MTYPDLINRLARVARLAQRYRPSAKALVIRPIAVVAMSLALIASACGGSEDVTDGVADAADTATDAVADAVEDATSGDADDEYAVDDSGAAYGTDQDDEAAMASEPAPMNEAATDLTSGATDSEDGFSASIEQADRAESGQPRDGDAEGLFVQPDIEPIQPEPTPIPNRFDDNRFTDYGYRRFIETDEDPFSTFALDVDTGSYTVARRWLAEGAVPPPQAVRVEEFINWFDYDYDIPRRGLEISVDGGPSPFDEDNVLVRVGVQAEVVADNDRPPANLTFIIDTSGSMNRDDRLGLVRESLKILVDELHDDDTVAIVIYSNDSGVLLSPTEVRHSGRIYDAIDELRPGGSTNLESGLREGYNLALEAFREGGINRVIIASDGVANAGVTDQVELSRLIRRYANEGIQLVTVGYGMGNFNDTMMEQLADHGDGFYAYVDNEDEAERLFEHDLTSTLVTAAIDAKIQVEFDPDIVDEYRLIGFENRGVRDSDFRNDAVDAGELGAGHQVTAMYEINLRRGVDLDDRGGIGEVFLRWQDPDTSEVIEIDQDIDLRDVEPNWNDTSDDFQLATVVTAFGEVMRDNPYADHVSLSNIHVEAERVADKLDDDKVDELVDLLQTARQLY